MSRTLTNTASITAGSALAMISVYCSAILWSSFASTTADQIIAASIAATLVACQYLFFIVRKNHTGKTKHAHTAAVIILFITSAAATIAWLESRYQASNKTELKSDVIYNQKITHLAELNKKLSTLNTNAQADTNADFRARAKSTLREAEQTEYKIEKLTREISQHKTIGNNAGSTLANNLSDARWVFWALLAALIDICPMLCFANVAKKIIDIDLVTTERATNRNNQTVAPQHAPSNKVTNTDELTPKISEEIHNGMYGDKPSVRAVMIKHGIRHDRVKIIFDQLAEMNVIIREGQRFKRIQRAQEQPA